MRVNYKFSNLLGTVYKKGNIGFTPDGTTLLSPVGNRITLYDLKNNASETLPIESKFDISLVAQSPTGNALILVNEHGEAFYVSLISRTILHRHRFNKKVRDIQFSPDGRKFAVCRDTDVQIFSAPGPSTRHYNPFLLLSTHHVSHTHSTTLAWAADSQILAVGCNDMKTVVVGAENYKNLYMYSIGGHTGPIAATFFLPDSYELLTLDKRGFMVHWECNLQGSDLVPCAPGFTYRGPKELSDEQEETDESDEEEPSGPPVTKISFSKIARHRFHDAVPGTGVKLTCAAFDGKRKLLVSGFSNGAFTLHEMPEFNLIHNLSVSETSIMGVCINGSGDWLGLACGEEGKGQLVVWEWESETFVLKEQGHLHNTACLAFSPDALYIATGGEDAKVKVWSVRSGFCVATFSEHTGGIRGIGWSQGGKAVVSASLDGSVRAFDMKRFRNFKTLTSPSPVQFSCLAVDGSGEVVAAGAQDVFQVFLWSIQSGRLLEVLSGHEGPVSSVDFNGSENQLLTTSWDKTMRVWEVFEGKGGCEVVQLSSEGLCGKFSPDGRTVAALGLNSQIHFYDWKTGTEVGSLECALDVDPGRAESDVITAKKSGKSKSFTTFSYSPEGEWVVVGGQSAHVVLYNVPAQLLVRKFTLTTNYSLDAVAEDYDPHRMSEFGPLARRDSDSDEEVCGPGPQKVKLGGVRSGDASGRTHRPEMRVTGVAYSPTGRVWAATSTEGLLLYSLDHTLLFDPFQLHSTITPHSIRAKIREGEHGEALLMALKLNQSPLIQEAFQQIPPEHVDVIGKGLPIVYVERLLLWMSDPAVIDKTPHIQFYLSFIQAVLCWHGREVKERWSGKPHLAALLHTLAHRRAVLAKLADSNQYSLDYLLAARKLHSVSMDQ